MFHMDINVSNDYKNFLIEIPLDKDFINCYRYLVRKYGEEFQRLNGLHNENLNFSNFIDHFTADNETNVANVVLDQSANSNTRDVRTLISDMTKPHTKLLSLHKIFYEIKKKYGLAMARIWFEGEWNGLYYLHDAHSASLMPYCFAYDLDQIVEKGLYFINKFKPQAPKHLTTFNDHVLETISWLSNRSAGAVGLPSYLIYSFYFWKRDTDNGYYLKNPTYYAKQCFQKFIYDLNQPYLRITECAFTNITIMDREYLISLFGERKYPDGTYIIDYVEELMDYQKLFMQTLSEVREEMMFTFPVVTYSLLFQNGKFVDEEFARYCCNHNMKWCDANFYVGNDVTSLSSCCRLINDFSKLDKLDGFMNSIGGTSLKIGSVKVNTINLRRIALQSKNIDGNLDENLYLANLRESVETCIKVLDVVRSIIKRNIEKHILPNYTSGLIDINRQFNTIGINAMYETLRDFGYIKVDETGNHYYSEDAIRFSTKILDTINEIKDAQSFDYSINVEAVPGERCAVILRKKDNLLYHLEDDGALMYSNQWIPLVEKCTLNEKIKLGSLLDKKVGGGQIAHITVDGDFATSEQAWDMLNYIANQGVVYFAYNKRISVCANEHAFIGTSCPHCGGKAVDYFTRIVGYLVPTSAYSKERKMEESQRYLYNLNDSLI